MTTSYTSLLGLALPVQGELTGTWGTTVNNYITQYLDAAVAGAQTISGSQTAVTLSVANGVSLSQAASAATGSSQYAIINCTGNPASLLTITAPAASKVYLVINATSTNQSVKVVGVGPTTGVTIAANRAALIAWNGSDFRLVATTDASQLSGILPVANGGTGLSSGTSGGVPYFSGSTTIASSGALVANALVVGGGAGAAPSTVTTGTGVVTALGVNVGSAGAVVVNGGALGTPSSGTLTSATGLPLTTGVTGVLPIANGGTNSTAAATAGGVGYGTGTAHAYTAAGSSNQVLISNGASAPSWSNLSSLGVTSFSAGTTGFTPNTGTTGAVTLAGTLATTNGGTGLASFTANRVLYTSSTSAIGQSANLTFDGATLTTANDAVINTLTVGRGAGAVGSNTTVGLDALKNNVSGVNQTAIGRLAMSYMRGQDNTALGCQAMTGSATPANNTGDYNTAIGSNAGYQLTNAQKLTTVGAFSSYLTTASTNVVAIGFQAGIQNNGDNNVFVGSESGYSGWSGTHNVAVGRSSLFYNDTGAYQTAVGSQAMLYMRGSNNTALGYRGMYGSGTPANNTGAYNVALGTEALYSLSSGVGNVAVGSSALNTNSTSGYNTAIGWQAAQNTTGGNNTAVGGQALISNTTGGNQTAVGMQAMFYMQGNYNIALGTTALFGSSTPANNTGSYNIAIGGDAMYSATSGSYNTASGYQAAYYNSSGSNNTAIGSQALTFNVSGSNQTALGSQAMYNMRGGTNTALGNQAMYGSGTPANNTGTYNVAVGSQALYVVTSGGYNVAVGTQSLYNLTSGLSNVAVGYAALFNNQSEINNSALGYGALVNMRGNDNTGVGYRALAGSSTPANNTGYNNTAVGEQALHVVTSGYSNTAIGHSALSALTAGANNTVIGYGSGSAITTGSSNVVIGGYTGNNGVLDIRTASNYIVLSDGAGNPRWYIDNNGAAGYGPSTGGTVTQTISRTTSVTINKPTGAITLVSAAGTTTWQSFTVSNTTVTALDTVIVNQKSGTDLYQIFVTNVAANSFRITFATTGGTTTEQPVFTFAVIKGQTA